MPHKHTRRLGQKDDSQHDLPPTAVARALPAGKQPVASAPSKKRKRGNAADDTPKAFARILQYQKIGTRPSGLDEGAKPSKKRKRKQGIVGVKDDAEGVGARHAPNARQVLKLLPGERLNDFSARVNQSLPVAGLKKKGKKVDGMQERRTRLEKKITKRQDAWRKEDERRKEKADEQFDEVEDDEMDYWGTGSGRKSKRRRRQGDTGVLADDDDPWEKLKALRGKQKGLHDVVQAPPDFKKAPSVKLKDKTLVDVPPSAGGMKRRRELGEARKHTVEAYRRMMGAKRDQASP